MNFSSDIKLANKIALFFLSSNYKLKIKKVESGIINDTFLVLPFKKYEFKPFILQRVSSQVFRKPIDLISNYLVLEEYLGNDCYLKQNME